MTPRGGALAAGLLLVVAVAAAVLLPRPFAGVIVAAAGMGILVLGRRLAADRPPGPATAAASGARPAPEGMLEAVEDAIGPLPIGVVLLDRELTVLVANRGVADLVGQPREPMRGVSLIRATREVGLVEVARAARGEPVDTQLASGLEVIAVAAPVAIDRARVLLAIEDVTALRRAARARTDLVGNLSHELRTPLASARALAETVRDGVDEEAERRRFLERLVQDLERLSGMVQGMVRLARLDAAAEELAAERLDPLALLELTRHRLGPIAEQRGVAIVVAADGPLREVVGDERRTLEVLSNLVDNALRHSDAGDTVALSAHEEGGTVRFEVRDEGPGVLPPDRARIFERFYTGEAARTGGEGSGLGLAIARHLVDGQGGRIWVADRTPGATFCFTLPAAEAGTSSTPGGQGSPERSPPPEEHP